MNHPSTAIPLLRRALPLFAALLLPLPSPAADAVKTVKVFVLAGQSNMEGQGVIAADPQRNGGKGTLEQLVEDPASAPRFAQLIDSAGKWRVRDDVWIHYLAETYYLIGESMGRAMLDLLGGK